MNNKNSKITRYNFLWRVLQTFSKQGIVFIITFLSAKLLTPINFGNYSYILTIALFTITLSDMGVSAAISRFVAESKAKNSNDEDKYLISGLISVFIISSLIVVICYLVLPVFLEERMNLFYLIMPVIIFSPISSVFDGFYRGIGKFKKISIISFFNGIFSVAYIYLLIDGFGLKGALVSQSLFYFLLAISFIFTYKNKKGISWDISQAKKIISYSVIIGLSSIAAFFYSKVDILILGKFGYIKEVGYYELVLQFFTIIVLPTSILSQVLAPKITYKLNFDDKSIYTYYKKKMLLLLTYSIVISFFFYWVSPILLKYFLSKYYVEEVFVAISIMAFLIPAKVWGVFQNQAFIVSTGKAKIVLYTTIVGGLLNVVLDYIFIKKYGFVGVYYVTLFVHTLNIVIQTLYFNNYLRNHVK